MKNKLIIEQKIQQNEEVKKVFKKTVISPIKLSKLKNVRYKFKNSAKWHIPDNF